MENTDSPVSVRLFGPLSVEDSEGRAIVLRGRRNVGLFVYLAARAGVRTSREQVASMFWGHTGDRARHNLRQALSAVRKAFGEAGGDVVVTDGDMLVVPPEVVAVDVVAFRELAPSEDPRELGAAMAFYDAFLPDLHVGEDEFDAWRSREQGGLCRLALGAASRLARATIDAGAPEDAVDPLRRILRVDPACEEAHRLLMECFEAAGRRADALRQYEACAEALDRALDATPHPETDALLARLRAEPEATGRVASAPLPLPSRPSVAVLPFRNLSDDREQRYFSDGISEDLTVALSRFANLFVIAWQSAFRYRGAEIDTRVVGRELGVHYLVAGSVRRAGKRVRVTAELVDASTGAQLWSNRFDRDLEDIFAVQDELTETIVATLVGRVQSHRLEVVRQAPTESLEAYDCLLRGKDHHHRYTAEDSSLAQELFARAIELDPKYAAAHAWMACVLAQRNTFAPDPRLFECAFDHVRQALEVDEGEPECHRILAAYYLLRRRFEDARRHQARALELNPNDDRIVCQSGELLVYEGRPAEAIEWVERALRLNPYHPGSFHGTLGHALFDSGRAAEAVRVLRRAPQKQAIFVAVNAAALDEAGFADEARAELERLTTVVPAFDVARFTRRLPYETPEHADRLRDALMALAES